MNVSDLQGQKSHLQAECDRIVEIRKRLNNLKPTEFGYIVLDELFSGASHKERSALETTVTEALGSRNNVLSMVVSHNKSLPRLEQPGNAFKNYQLLVNDLAIPLFQLREGVSNRRTAFQVARQRGMPEEQIQRAQRLLDHHARKKRSSSKRSHR
jgi:DNA mismatch repair ATPase MutS